eukprot:Skav212403  [mRNA]  locus=scaffold469:100412:101278:- [translate_table: standard]
MGRTLGAFFANLLNMGGEAPRTLSEDDFVKWYSTLKPPQPTIVGEALPPGVPTMASRYGVFGSKSLMTGVPGDENNTPNACADAEARPAAPCEATGECEELSELATKFQQGSNIARALALNAVNAMQVAQVLLRRVEKAAANLVNMPEIDFQSASQPNGPGAQPWPLVDQLVLTIRGPILNDNPTLQTDIDENFLTRKMEQWDYEHRTVEYLQKVEGNKPLEFIETLGRMPIYEPMPKPTPMQDVAIPRPANPLVTMEMPAVAFFSSVCWQISFSLKDRRQGYRDFLL